jgi:hypothetical protein
MTKVAQTVQLIMLKLDAKFQVIPMDDFQVLADENLWDVRICVCTEGKSYIHDV